MPNSGDMTVISHYNLQGQYYKYISGVVRSGDIKSKNKKTFCKKYAENVSAIKLTLYQCVEPV